MKRSLRVFWAAAAAVLLGCVFGCAFAGGDAGSSSSAGRPAAALSSDGGGYTIRVPDGWRKLDGLSEDAILSCGGPAREQYLIIIPDSRSATGMTLQEYTSVVLHQISAGLEDAAIGQSAEFPIGEHAALRTQVSGTVEGVKVRYLVYTAGFPDDYLQIVAWTLEEKADETQPLFDEIVRTLSAGE